MANKEELFAKEAKSWMRANGMFKDSFKVTCRGYSIEKPKNGKYKLTLYTKKGERVYLNIDEEDSKLGYKQIIIMHNRGVYTYINKHNKYDLWHYEYSNDVGIIHIIMANEDGSENYLLETIKRENYALYNKIKQCSITSKYKEEVQFKSTDDFYNFCKDGYKVLEDDITLNKRFINFQIQQKIKEIARLNKEVKELEKLKGSLN